MRYDFQVLKLAAEPKTLEKALNQAGADGFACINVTADPNGYFLLFLQRATPDEIDEMS